MAVKIERKYVLTKIAAGDYLLPSNDGKTIWRIMRYEDGPSYSLDWPKDRMVWGAWSWRGDLDRVDPDAWDMWACGSQWCDTRQQAIDEALSMA